VKRLPHWSAIRLTSFLADPNDWVNVNYVLQQANVSDPSTTDARNGIIVSAGTTAKKGPWSWSLRPLIFYCTEFLGVQVLPTQAELKRQVGIRMIT
jgi:hypothetical protein